MLRGGDPEEGDADSGSSEGFVDPEPVCKPPAWAAELIAEARARAGREVYPPSDDTFLLLEALAADGGRLRAMRPHICLEVGCGSGAVLAGLREVLLGNAPSEQATEGPAADRVTSVGGARASNAAAIEEADAGFLIAVDKNPAAAACAAGLLAARGVLRAIVVRGSLTSPFRLAGAVDVCICNPPYVPTEVEEMRGCGIEASWAGGARGRQVIDRLLPEVARVLAPGGLFYLVCMAENEPEEIMGAMRHLGLAAMVARQERRGIEELFILRFERPCGLSDVAGLFPD